MLDSLLEEGLDIIRPKLPGKLIFLKVWGSWSHNTNIPESDVDYLAVYECHPLDLLRIDPPTETVDGVSPDFQSHELGKFLQLLRKGNPGVVECLFTKNGYWESSMFMQLRKKRKLFLNETTLKSYLGYCNGQLRRLTNGNRLHTSGGGYNTKWAYHLIRLALDAERIAGKQEPLVWKDSETKEHNLLMRIRAGEFSPDQIERMFNEIDQRIQDIKAKVTLPAEVPLEELNKFLLKERTNTWLIDER